MPTIEIASINSEKLELNQAEFEIAIIEENKLKSHRGLFFEILKKQKGSIVHIGNTEFRNDKDGGYFAGKLINWEFTPKENLISIFEENETVEIDEDRQVKFQFLNQFVEDVNRILEIALEKSTIKKICFLTDYQFGPEKANIENVETITEFWKKHKNEGLKFNTMYEIGGK